MNEEKIFEALEQFPKVVDTVKELSETVNNNNKVISDSVKTVSRDVKDMENRMFQMEQKISILKNSVDAASTTLKKGVAVNVPPVTVRRSDVGIAQTPLSDSQLDAMAEILAKKTKSKTKGEGFFLIMLIITILSVVAYGISLKTAYNNDYRGWGARYVEVGKAAGDLHPGDRFLYVQEAFSKGRKSRKAAKALVVEEEEKYNKQYTRNARIISRDLIHALLEEVVVLDYSVVSSDSLGYEAFSIFRLTDKENRHAAHLLRNGDVFINSDSDLVMTAGEAKKHPGRSTWKKIGNYMEK